MDFDQKIERIEGKRLQSPIYKLELNLYSDGSNGRKNNPLSLFEPDC
ncbi:hypothetical protein P872_08620 [Rhodonellum psychrophilum GCM71 = DSM 17998]|uniref:Uncharacterized protein n=1 Tax=Rhodonellum psychrophilum GCM71 = DSM 17998 TaxID=1123057 RepID=U5C1I9_9BACT|nr:hypothetical protein P872_08620 [Rhodonellum psychrophilum GCM71 = DSM 17998]